MSLKERLKEAGLKYSDLERSVNKKYHAIAKAVDRESFSDLEYEKISKDFRLNSKWLKNGEGEMAVNNEPKTDDECFEILDRIEKAGFPKDQIDILRNRIHRANAIEKQYYESMEVLRKEFKIKL